MIFNHKVVISQAGVVAQSEWFRTLRLRENVELFKDEFVVMPNHVHGIIWLIGDPYC